MVGLFGVLSPGTFICVLGVALAVGRRYAPNTMARLQARSIACLPRRCAEYLVGAKEDAKSVRAADAPNSGGSQHRRTTSAPLPAPLPLPLPPPRAAGQNGHTRASLGAVVEPEGGYGSV